MNKRDLIVGVEYAVKHRSRVIGYGKRLGIVKRKYVMPSSIGTEVIMSRATFKSTVAAAWDHDFLHKFVNGNLEWKPADELEHVKTTNVLCTWQEQLDKRKPKVPAPALLLVALAMALLGCADPAPAAVAAASSTTGTTLASTTSTTTTPPTTLPTTVTTPTSAVSTSAPTEVGKAVPTDQDFERLRACECPTGSKGAPWHCNTGNGYEGGLQFDNPTWLGYGGGEFADHAYDATIAEQIEVGLRLWYDRGWQPWPTCAATAGLA